MPELPDVEVRKEYLDANALNQIIETTEVRGPELLKETTARQLQQAMNGKVFASSRRHGKYLFVLISGGKWLVMHFGMTGYLDYFRDRREEPRFTQVLISFENGDCLAYVAPRKLGRIQLIDDVQKFIESQRLGPDAMDPAYSFRRFHDSFAKSNSMIKTALMNQKTLAGVGNEYSDEILYQAGIHPEKKSRDLSEGELRRVYKQMRKVLKTAIERKADPAKFPRTYIMPHRHGDGKCPGGQGELKSIKVGGRTAFFCPSRQRK
jgi:formamidopyrimidine-DNA glycosylase